MTSRASIGRSDQPRFGLRSVGSGLLLGLAVATGAGASAQELLVNGNAEVASLAAWSATPEVKIVAAQVQTAGTVTPFEGALFFTFAGKASGSASMVQGGTTGLSAGALFVLRGRVQVEFGDLAEARVRFFQGAALLGSATTGPMNPATGLWDTFELPAVVPLGSDRWEVELRGTLVTGTFVNVFYDLLSLSACNASVAAAEVVRLGSPPNPSALLPGLTSAPVLGATWDPVISHASFAPNATLDLLCVTPGPTNVSLPGLGTLLCNTAQILILQPVPAGQPFQVPVPASCGLVGVGLYTQGASVDANGVISLTNALDITLGTF
ncbi:hypothetical protein [Engelhardtia mirabilis]|uniref:hypothetical protein n=1 Tax=Engelhardtia mirabilis TaxID=2528011 RepID=UPI0011A820D4